MVVRVRSRQNTLVGDAPNAVVLLGDRSHQLTPLNGPVNEHLGFFPTRFHRLTLKQHDNDEVSVFLKDT